jgi:predicted Zn-dependent peptidase
MALRGAGERDSHRFIEDLDNLGVERSESVSDSHTSYSGATLAANLPRALAIYADVVRRPHLPGEQLEAGRQVMLQELRAVEDEPSQKVMLELRRRHYPDPWGRPSQGELEAVETASIDEIRRFHGSHYRPNGTILGVAGRFDWRQLQETVGELLGDWQRGDEGPIVDAGSMKKYDHLPYESNQTQIGISYPSVPFRHPDYFQAWGAVGVLSGGMSARLFTEVRERRGLCYSVYAMYHTLRDRGGVFCYAGTSAERAQETLDVTAGELMRLAKGVEAHEIDRLKARIKSALIMQQESSSARSSAIGRDWFHLGRVRSLEEIGSLVDGLSWQSISAYLAEHPPGDLTVVTLGPQELEVPVGLS